MGAIIELSDQFSIRTFSFSNSFSCPSTSVRTLENILEKSSVDNMLPLNTGSTNKLIHKGQHKVS